MIEMRAFAQGNLGHGVGEVTAVPQGDVALDHGRARVTTRDDEIPRMRHALSIRDEHEMDRLLDDRFSRQLDERAIVDERSVERGERVLLECRNLADVALNARCSGFDRACETAHADAFAESRGGREILRELAVYEDEGVPAVLAEVAVSYTHLTLPTNREV